MKILVVEDNKKLLEGIVKEISSHFQCESCEDGEEALYLIKQDIYDLVVLDLMLPNLNGLDILKKMRDNYIDTPVIILTAKESLDDKVGAFSIGANDYLTKPFYMEELIARIYAILRTNGKINDKNSTIFIGSRFLQHGARRKNDGTGRSGLSPLRHYGRSFRSQYFVWFSDDFKTE